VNVGKVLLLVFGVIILLGGCGLLFGGGVLVWAYHAPTDPEGYVSSGQVDIERSSYAVVTGPVELDEEGLAMLEWLGLSAIKVEGSSNDPSKQIFIGVAQASDLQHFLDDVSYDELTRVTHWLSFRGVRYFHHPGDSEPPTPLIHSFWQSSVHGPGVQDLEWEPEPGSHALVLMNDDASPGLDMTVQFQVQVPVVVFALGVALLVGGTVALILGIVMVYFAVRKP
jgi:hypothetical protein